MFGVTTDCPQEASPSYNGHPQPQVRGQGSGACGSAAVEQCTFGSGCTKAASPRVFAPSEHPGVKRNRGTGWAGNCRVLGPVIHIAGRWSAPHHFSLSGAGTWLTIHTLGAEEQISGCTWCGYHVQGHWLSTGAFHALRQGASVPRRVCVPYVLCHDVWLLFVLAAAQGGGGGAQMTVLGKTAGRAFGPLGALLNRRWFGGGGGGQGAVFCRRRRAGAPVCIKGPRSTESIGRKIIGHGAAVSPGSVCKGPAGVRHLECTHR